MLLRFQWQKKYIIIMLSLIARYINCNVYFLSYNVVYYLSLYISYLIIFQNVTQLHLANVDGRCTIVHCANSCYTCTRMNTASVMTVCIMLYVFIMRWPPRRPITRRSSMFFGCRLPTRLNISFRQG